MSAKATVTIALGAEREAKALAQALAADAEGFLEVHVAGPTLTLKAGADTVMGLLRTLDDALAGVQAADIRLSDGS